MSRQATETTMDIVDPRDHNWNDDLSLQRPKMVLQDSEDEVSDASFDADIKDLTEEYLMNMLVNSNFKDVQIGLNGYRRFLIQLGSTDDG